MNITEFAERIVFGRTLDEKLAPLDKLAPQDFDRLDLHIDRVQTPGRPPGLALNDGQGASQPPSDHQLDNERNRGRLLHFLANHELLATELMALVLLKFPDAPTAFRRGVLITLQDEQLHTRYYLDRMQECGIELGSYPLSGHFWRIVEPMKSPMDFVARLSLTFEQANLDYTLHYAERFRQVDDQPTASILQQIYEDEITHVQHGLHWFRQWKQPDQSDWDAYRQALEFPMSPQRARGPSCEFNHDGRRRAGLADDFIDAVRVYRQSRGRPPTVRWFDAGPEAELHYETGQLAEAEGGRGVGQGEASLLNQLTQDLELTLIPLAKQDDVQLVQRMPSVGFLKTLVDSGLELPELITVDESQVLLERKLRDLCPWSWTPRSHKTAARLARVTQVRRPRWQATHAQFYRKSWCTSRISAWMQSEQTPAWMSAAAPGFVVHSTADVERALQQLLALGFTTSLFKTDLSTSGRNQRRLHGDQLSDRDRLWLKSRWEQGHAGVMEPELHRVLDISFLWDLSEGQRQFLGWTRPLVSPGRRYFGTLLRRPFADCEPAVKRFLLAEQCAKLNTTAEWLEQHVVRELEKAGFAHLLGIDAMLHQDATDALKLHPCVEVNPRCTMGHVALALDKHIAPTTQAHFRIFTRAEWDPIAPRFADMQLKQDRSGRWQAGFLPLVEVNERTKLVPAVLVGAELELPQQR